MINRKSDLVSIVSSLDISPTMYQNAKTKYESMASFLKSHGVECTIYPQGSFRTGTIIRPYRDGENCDYDLDMVCELSTNKESTNPRRTKQSVGRPLSESGVYNKVKEDDRCYTIEYANISENVGFKIDIVPSVKEDINSISRLISTGTDSRFANEAISITDKVSSEKYVWLPSNPKGYALWFEEINEPFLAHNRQHQRQAIFENNQEIYFSVDEVPSILERSALQRVIQIIKRHKAVYYSHVSKNITSPISAVITTLSAQIARGVNPQISVFDLLQYVIKEMQIYSQLTTMSTLDFENTNPSKRYIKRSGNKWTIRNPVHYQDNYTENWNEQDIEVFFKWITALKVDLVDNIESSNEIYFNSMERGLGSSLVEKFITRPKPLNNPIIPSKVKNWGANE